MAKVNYRIFVSPFSTKTPPQQQQQKPRSPSNSQAIIRCACLRACSSKISLRKNAPGTKDQKTTQLLCAVLAHARANTHTHTHTHMWAHVNLARFILYDGGRTQFKFRFFDNLYTLHTHTHTFYVFLHFVGGTCALALDLTPRGPNAAERYAPKTRARVSVLLEIASAVVRIPPNEVA